MEKGKIREIFYLLGDQLTHTETCQFELTLLPDAKIVCKRQYRILKHTEEVERRVGSLLAEGIIEPSISSYNHPILLVPKKTTDGQGQKKYRLCVDFRELNKICKPYSFPLPRITDIIDRLGKAKWFSTLDLSQGYHQVLIRKEDREKTAFSTSKGHYQYRRCPFGLSALPGFFQSMINHILAGLQGTECFVYLDDVVIFGKDQEEHTHRLERVFERLREHNLKLNAEKWRFLQKEVVYLGHKCTREGVEPNEILTETIQKVSTPKNVKQVQSFLGAANYYRQFIPNFAKEAAALYKCLRKGEVFKWTEGCEQAFQKLKNMLTSAPILAYPQFGEKFSITCDASRIGLGAVLEQEGHVISYASRTLNDAETRWTTTELELNAIVFGCKTFRYYILDRNTEVFTDHKPLRGIMKLQDASSRIIRLLEKLSQYDLNIEYKKGRENQCADFLSRLQGNEVCQKISCGVVTRSKTYENLDSGRNQIPAHKGSREENSETKKIPSKEEPGVGGPEPDDSGQ